MTGCAESVADYLRKHDLTLSTAESCTSGLIAAKLADVPGAGACLDRAFVTYSVAGKIEMLGVSQETIDTHNLTSEAVAREMALGALRRSGANVAISDTGVVDDTDADIPAGTQCMAWAFKREAGEAVFTETRVFTGDRIEIRTRCADYALSRIAHYHAQLG